MTFAACVSSNGLQPYCVTAPKLGDLRVRRQLAPIRGAVPSLFERPAGCAFHPRCDSFMAGRCDARLPELTEIAPRHDVRCFLYETAREQAAS